MGETRRYSPTGRGTRFRSVTVSVRIALAARCVARRPNKSPTICASWEQKRDLSAEVIGTLHVGYRRAAQHLYFKLRTCASRTVAQLRIAGIEKPWLSAVTLTDNSMLEPMGGVRMCIKIPRWAPNGNVAQEVAASAKR